MRSRRLLQFIFGGLFGVSGLVLLGFALANWATGGPAALFMALVPLVLGVIATGMLELQIRSLTSQGKDVQANVEAIAARLFDAPGAVRPGYDMTVTSGAAGAVMKGFETDVGFTADGSCNGVKVSAASHVSTLGRQLGEMSHVYSHVVVDVLGLSTTFRLSKEGVGSKLGRAVGVVRDAKVGDESFDAAWNVDVEEALARDVLDDSIRARLMELASKVGYVSQDFGAGTMSVILTQHGLALRWPGPMNAELARYVRDLLLDIRGRMLTHLDRKAAGGAEGTAYRIAADATPPPVSSAPLEEDAPPSNEEEPIAARAKA